MRTGLAFTVIALVYCTFTSGANAAADEVYNIYIQNPSGQPAQVTTTTIPGPTSTPAVMKETISIKQEAPPVSQTESHRWDLTFGRALNSRGPAELQLRENYIHAAGDQSGYAESEWSLGARYMFSKKWGLAAELLQPTNRPLSISSGAVSFDYSLGVYFKPFRFDVYHVSYVDLGFMAGVTSVAVVQRRPATDQFGNEYYDAPFGQDHSSFLGLLGTVWLGKGYSLSITPKMLFDIGEAQVTTSLDIAL